MKFLCEVEDCDSKYYLQTYRSCFADNPMFSQAALDKITGVAIHINKVKRVQELESHEILGWTVSLILTLLICTSR